MVGLNGMTVIAGLCVPGCVVAGGTNTASDREGKGKHGFGTPHFPPCVGALRCVDHAERPYVKHCWWVSRR